MQCSVLDPCCAKQGGLTSKNVMQALASIKMLQHLPANISGAVARSPQQKEHDVRLVGAERHYRGFLIATCILLL